MASPPSTPRRQNKPVLHVKTSVDIHWLAINRAKDCLYSEEGCSRSGRQSWIRRVSFSGRWPALLAGPSMWKTSALQEHLASSLHHIQPSQPIFRASPPFQPREAYLSRPAEGS